MTVINDGELENEERFTLLLDTEDPMIILSPRESEFRINSKLRPLAMCNRKL